MRIFLTGDNHIGLKYASHEQASVLCEKRIEPMSIKWTEKRENQIKSCSAWLGDRPLLCEWGLTEL